MRKAREAMGDEARLLRARRISGWNDPVPAYEVSVTSAATEEESASENLAALRREIEELKRLVSTRATSDAHGANESELDADHEVWIDRLRRRGIPRLRAEQIVREAAVAAPGDVAGAIARTIASDLESHADSRPLGERPTVFVGPSGAGKTTTIAKVAADLGARGKRPVLVTTDGESVAGEDELARVAHALGLPFETAFFSGQLAALVGSPGSKGGLLVDTPGRSPFSDEGLQGLEEIVGAIPDAEVVLVLAATTDREEARALGLAFRSLGVGRVVITKLDELGRPGRLVELAGVLGAPIARVTHGRDVRGTSSHASDAAVLARVLGSSGAVETRA
jgi:flagellar biosynthesis protein FlhF